MRTCLAALRDQTSPSAGPGVLSLEEVQVALAGAELHAAAAKELAELLKVGDIQTARLVLARSSWAAARCESYWAKGMSASALEADQLR